MADTFVPSDPVITRRATLARLGTGGLALGLATRARPALAQEGTPPASAGEVPSFLQDWVAGWEDADAGRLAAVYADDAVVDIMPFNTALRGPEEIEQYFAAYFDAFDAPNARIVTLFATADRAAAEWTFDGEYTGQLPGLPPGEGQPVSVRGANIMTLRDDQIVEEHIYADLAGLLGQLGVIQPPTGTPSAATPAG